jgi:predicted flap endonuclease-1-like 5' DNA nuclease
VQVRQKLTEFESTIAFVIGGGLILLMLVFGLASASGGTDVSRLNLFLILGALLLFGGMLVWLFASRPWLKRDDWSEPLYTGHEHEEHHAEGAEAVAEHAETLAHAGAAEPSELAAAMNVAPATAAVVAAVEAATAAPEQQTEQIEPHPVAPEEPQSAYAAVEQPAYAQVPEARVPDQAAEAAEQIEPHPLAPEPQPEAAEVAAHKPDDLTLIEGIGPKISAALVAAGIDTFAKLAAMQPEEIEKVVRSAGVRMVGKPETWAKQAALAAEGKFDELKAYQKTLTAGRSASDE